LEQGQPNASCQEEMNGMPRVALVFPHFRTRALTEMLFPPLGAAILAAQLRKIGIEVRVFDGTFVRS